MSGMRNCKRGEKSQNVETRALNGTRVHSANMIGNTKLGAESMYDQSKGKVRMTTNKLLKKARK